MIIDRKKNTKRNIIFGVCLKFHMLVVPFIMRTIMIYQMGIEYTGLNNLFVSIFQILNLTELGIGGALTFSMYKPIAEDNNDLICALFKFYKKCFNIIGMIIFVIGILLIPFLKYLVYGDIPEEINLIYLYLLYLLNTVLSYTMFSYKKSLLYAHQRNDVISRIMLITLTLQFIFQIYVIIFIKNYYLYVVAMIIAQIFLNVISAIMTSKLYPQYKPKGRLAAETLNDIKLKIKGLVANKIGTTILISADSIIISSFLGLVLLSMYQNYYFVLTAVMGIFAIIFESCKAGIGNSLIVETKEKNCDDFKKITMFSGILICISCSCFIALFQPFIQIWVGKKYLLSQTLVFAFTAYFFVCELQQILGLYKDAGGIWYSDRYRTLTSAIVNIILSLILVNLLGILGVVLATIIVIIFIDLPWLTHNLFKNIFGQKHLKSYVLELLRIVLCTLLSAITTYFISQQIVFDGILNLVIQLIIAVITSGIFVLVFYFKKIKDIKNFVKK